MATIAARDRVRVRLRSNVLSCSRIAFEQEIPIRRLSTLFQLADIWFQGEVAPILNG